MTRRGGGPVGEHLAGSRGRGRALPLHAKLAVISPSPKGRPRRSAAGSVPKPSKIIREARPDASTLIR